MNTSNIICYSGGAEGADTIFETLCVKNEIKVEAFSFDRHSTQSKNRVILTHDELVKADPYLREVNETIKRVLPFNKYYVMCLLRRNYFQVRNTQRVYAVSRFNDDGLVEGGTAWAVYMAINFGIPVYFYEQFIKQWLEWDFTDSKWINVRSLPLITENLSFTGIGEREIEENGMYAIINLFKTSSLKT